MITELITEAIQELKLIGVNPTLINLTDEDYKLLLKECNSLTTKKFDRITQFEGIEVDRRLPDKDEGVDEIYTQSMICSDSIYQGFQLISRGRGFNLHSLQEFFL